MELTERLTELTERAYRKPGGGGGGRGDEQGGCCSLQRAGKEEAAETGERSNADEG